MLHPWVSEPLDAVPSRPADHATPSHDRGGGGDTTDRLHGQSQGAAARVNPPVDTEATVTGLPLRAAAIRCARCPTSERCVGFA
jgi:hypothetical protein